MSYYAYNTLSEKFTNKRMKIEVQSDLTHIEDDVNVELPDYIEDENYGLQHLQAHRLEKPETIVTNWKKCTFSNKQKHRQAAQQIRYKKLIELCGTNENLLEIYKLLDCRQYSQAGINDTIYYNTANPTQIISNMQNHGEPIKNLF